jgi:hypothetical protein
MRKVWLPAQVIVAGLLTASYTPAAQEPRLDREREQAMEQASATTYEHLAEAIVAIEQTERDLVKSILVHDYQTAHGHLRAAARDKEGRRAHAEAAAREITNIANEGDKPVQAVRQRLRKAGHTHNTDMETKDDYLFVNSREKKGLLALAQRVAQFGPDTPAEEFQNAERSLTELFEKAIAPE